MKMLILINDAPYGTEKAYNALRLAMSIEKDHPSAQVLVFLIADAVACAIPNQTTPQGYYNIERMLKSVVARGGKVKTCGSCLDPRGISNAQLIEGVERSNMMELARWSVEADKAFTF
ncbi:MAG: DsrE family protein [Candidatus Eisenbacteria bacterium]|nr:DsrE family protein [Candidatus Eisenbacteria bacterium]